MMHSATMPFAGLLFALLPLVAGNVYSQYTPNDNYKAEQQYAAPTTNDATKQLPLSFSFTPNTQSADNSHLTFHSYNSVPGMQYGGQQAQPQQAYSQYQPSSQYATSQDGFYPNQAAATAQASATATAYATHAAQFAQQFAATAAPPVVAQIDQQNLAKYSQYLDILQKAYGIQLPGELGQQKQAAAAASVAQATFSQSSYPSATATSYQPQPQSQQYVYGGQQVAQPSVQYPTQQQQVQTAAQPQTYSQQQTYQQQQQTYQTAQQQIQYPTAQQQVVQTHQIPQTVQQPIQYPQAPAPQPAQQLPYSQTMAPGSYSGYASVQQPAAPAASSEHSYSSYSGQYGQPATQYGQTSAGQYGQTSAEQYGQAAAAAAAAAAASKYGQQGQYQAQYKSVEAPVYPTNQQPQPYPTHHVVASTPAPSVYGNEVQYPHPPAQSNYQSVGILPASQPRPQVYPYQGPQPHVVAATEAPQRPTYGTHQIPYLPQPTDYNGEENAGEAGSIVGGVGQGEEYSYEVQSRPSTVIVPPTPATTRAPPRTTPRPRPTRPHTRPSTVRPTPRVQTTRPSLPPTSPATKAPDTAAGTTVQSLTQQIRKLPAVLYLDSRSPAATSIETLLRDTYGLPLVSFYVDKIDRPAVVQKHLSQLTAHKGLPYLFICGTFIGSEQHIENYHKNGQIPQLVEYVCGDEKKKTKKTKKISS